jgi:hypothetical protein
LVEKGGLAQPAQSRRFFGGEATFAERAPQILTQHQLAISDVVKFRAVGGAQCVGLYSVELLELSQCFRHADGGLMSILGHSASIA